MKKATCTLLLVVSVLLVYGQETAASDTSSIAPKVTGVKLSHPMYIVDGVEVTTASFHELNPNAIESIKIIKDPKALKVYGNKGQDAVIVVETKAKKVFPVGGN